jgi:hypothetical protein
MSTRIAFTARIRSGERAKLEQTFRDGPPFDPEKAGFDHHAVFLGDDDVMFLFEGDDPLPAVRKLAAEPGLLRQVMQMAGAVQAPHLMREIFTWDRPATGAEASR